MKKVSTAQKKRVQQCILDAGDRNTVCEHFKISHWAVSKWWHRGIIPPLRVKQLVKLANKNLKQEWRAKRKTKTKDLWIAQQVCPELYK